MHQLQALCSFIDHKETNYCAMQPCTCCAAGIHPGFSPSIIIIVHLAKTVIRRAISPAAASTKRPEVKARRTGPFIACHILREAGYIGDAGKRWLPDSTSSLMLSHRQPW
jgi:hypothetical protein